MSLIDKNILLKKLNAMSESIQGDIQKAKYDTKILQSELEIMQIVIRMVESENPVENNKEIPCQVIHTNSRAGVIYCFEWNECPICGTELTDDFDEEKYCSNCGQRLQWNMEEKIE